MPLEKHRAADILSKEQLKKNFHLLSNETLLWTSVAHCKDTWDKEKARKKLYHYPILPTHHHRNRRPVCIKTQVNKKIIPGLHSPAMWLPETRHHGCHHKAVSYASITKCGAIVKTKTKAAKSWTSTLKILTASDKSFIRKHYTGNNFESATELHFATINEYKSLPMPFLVLTITTFYSTSLLFFFFKSTLFFRIKSTEN